MVNTEAMNDVVSCVMFNDFVWVQFDSFWLEGVVGCGSGVTLTVEFGSGKALRSFVVVRLEDSLTAEASLWTK